MLRFLIVLLNVYSSVIFNVSSDMNIIENGKILKSKPYSTNEATLVVSKSKRIYICSILNDLTKCILTDEKLN